MAEPDAVTRALRTYYAACLDTARIEASKRAPIQALLNKANTVRNPDTYFRFVGEFHAVGIEPLFRLRVAPDPENRDVYAAWLLPPVLGLPDPRSYVGDDAASGKLRAEYEAYIVRMLEKLGQPDQLAKEGSALVLRIETELAKAVIASQARPAAPKKLTERELDALTPTLRWQWYRQGSETTEIAQLVAWDPEYFHETGAMLVKQRIEIHQAYLRWKVLDAAAPLLAREFADEHARFVRLADPAAAVYAERADSCAAETLAAFPDATGRAFAALVATPASQRAASSLVESLRAELLRALGSVAWLSEAERAKARETLTAMTLQIGAPSGPASPPRTAVDAEQYALDRFYAYHDRFEAELAKVGKPVDRSEWRESAATPEVVYEAGRNVLAVPAALLRPPYFDPAAAAPSNHAGLGALVAAELVRGLRLPAPRPDSAANTGLMFPIESSPTPCVATLARRMLHSADAVPGDAADLIAETAGLAAAHRAWLRVSAAKKPDLDAERSFYRAYAADRCPVAQAGADLLRARLRVLLPLATQPDAGRAFGCGSDTALGAKPTCTIWPDAP